MPAAGAPSLLPLVRLLQLASPTLPIGAYSYSQGLEWAVESGDVRDAASAHAGSATSSSASSRPAKPPCAWRLLDAAEPAIGPRSRRGMPGSARRAKRPSCGPKPSRRAARSPSFCRTSTSWMRRHGECVAALAPITLPAAYALAARAFRRAHRRGACGVRLVVARKPGAGGDQARAARPGCGTAAAACAGREDSRGRRDRDRRIDDDDLSTFAPGLALASARHETQYTRPLSVR